VRRGLHQPTAIMSNNVRARVALAMICHSATAIHALRRRHHLRRRLHMPRRHPRPRRDFRRDVIARLMVLGDQGHCPMTAKVLTRAICEAKEMAPSCEEPGPE
jgi:hypothetical protein